jgi:uncharacterized UBP type Zn finger protein
MSLYRTPSFTHALQEDGPRLRVERQAACATQTQAGESRTAKLAIFSVIPNDQETNLRNKQDDGDAEPPAKMTKLAIVEEREEDKYEHTLALRHYRASAAAATALDSSNTIFVPVEGIAQTNPHVRALVDGVMKSLSSGRQSEVQAWEEELLPCEHTLTLDQLATGHIPASGGCAILLFILRLRSEPPRWGMMGY